MNRVQAQAPSNIALIKYMGKEDASLNLPANPSLSMTLARLQTWVELEPSQTGVLRWIPEVPRGRDGLRLPDLSTSGQERFLKHWDRVVAQAPALLARFSMAVNDTCDAPEVRSASSFPAGSGIASSASSFAALTVASLAYLSRDLEHFRDVFQKNADFRSKIADLSRQGSGSSCRSLDGPFVFWMGSQVERVSSAMPVMSHFLILLDEAEKKVSSSEAHRRVITSPQWAGRRMRVASRMEQTLAALRSGDLPLLARIVFEEMEDMHRLFETAAQPFTYRTAETLAAVEFLRPSLENAQPPLITLDAGPNVHVIVPASERDVWRRHLQARFTTVLEDGQGSGASLA